MKISTPLLPAFILLLFTNALFAQQTQFRGGITHTGIYNSTKSFTNIALQWQYKTGGAVRSTPLIADGKVYVGSADGYVYCIDTTGKAVWKYKAAAAVHSSPALANGNIFFNDRNNNLYAVQAGNGKLLWKTQLGKTLPYDWGFDYYVASPLVVNNTIYTGSGDGNLYAVNAQTGNVQWQYNTHAIIRSTPAFDKGQLFIGDYNGNVYSIDAANGKPGWMFKGNGDTLHNEDYGFDRKAVLAAPVIAANIVVVGDRAGYLYALNETTGQKIWQFDYTVSWIISSVAIKDSIVVTGTSDGAFINALNLYTGKQLWKFQTTAPVWASPIINNNIVICPGNDGIIYGLDLYKGTELWRYSIGDKYFSSPVIAGNKLYTANDDGSLYCFTPAPAKPQVRRAVFWMKEPPFQSFQFGVDRYIKDYFKNWGYELLDDKTIAPFMQQGITSHDKSVVVFASNYFPLAITGDSAHPSLILDYLKAGGKAVVCAMNPAVYQLDSAGKQVTGLDFSAPKRILGITYSSNDTRTFNGFYPALPTAEGKQWGLQTGYVSRLGQPEGVADIVLMIDETGKATSWVKTYGGPNGTGFIQSWIFPATLQHIDELRNVAEYGF